MDKEEARPRAGVKSATAFRTISEVSDELDVPQHVLRFWETKFPQVRPLKRGGGRRYYRPEDVALLRNIRRLLYSEGYTIKGVQRLLKESRSAGTDGEAEGLVEGGLDTDGDGAEPSSVERSLSVADVPPPAALEPGPLPAAASLMAQAASPVAAPTQTPTPTPTMPPPEPTPIRGESVDGGVLPAWHRRQLVALRAELIELKVLLNKTMDRT